MVPILSQAVEIPHQEILDPEEIHTAQPRRRLSLGLFCAASDALRTPSTTAFNYGLTTDLNYGFGWVCPICVRKGGETRRRYTLKSAEPGP